MITRTATIEYRKRPAPRLPQTVKVCLACGGVCVALPMIGVACMDCKGKCFATVPENRWIEVRTLIEAEYAASLCAPMQETFDQLVVSH